MEKLVEKYKDQIEINLKATRSNLNNINSTIFLLEQDLEKRKWMKSKWGCDEPDDLIYFTERLLEDYKGEVMVLESKLDYFKLVLTEK